jgi:hypothetical protein
VNPPRIEPPTTQPPRRKPTVAQRVVGFVFIAAFGATMLTVIWTGLNVERPGARRGDDAEVVTLALGEPRTVQLVFDSRAAVRGVELTIDVPAGIEVVGHAAERRVIAHADLAIGSNALPLTLIARSGRGGPLAARLRHAGETKTFVVDLAVAER